MEIQVFEANNGDCPYLDNRKWLTYMFMAKSLENGTYESLLDYGFRRSGRFFYKNKCPSCLECVPIRVIVDEFEFSRSQKRIWKRNSDVHVERQPVEFDFESFELYQRYCEWKHQSETSVENYQDFLIVSAVNSHMMKYFLNDQLIGVGWIDVLPHSISSVYYAFSPEFHRRSLGIYSVLKEIELARSLKKTFLHLGFWVDHCHSMAYKRQFRPYQLLVSGKWISMPSSN